MEISMKGLKSFKNKVEAAITKNGKNLKKEVAEITENIATDARMLAPVDTGYLRENIQTRVYVNDEGINGEVYDNALYAAYVELGTGKPGEAAGLVREGLDLVYRQTPWVYQDEEGNWHYTEGMEPQPYLYPAMKQNEPDIKERLLSTITMELK